MFKLNPSSVTKAKRLHIDMDRAGTTYGGKKHRYLSDTLMGSFSDHLVWVVSSVRKCIRGVSYPTYGNYKVLLLYERDCEKVKRAILVAKQVRKYTILAMWLAELPFYRMDRQEMFGSSSI